MAFVIFGTLSYCHPNSSSVPLLRCSIVHLLCYIHRLAQFLKLFLSVFSLYFVSQSSAHRLCISLSFSKPESWLTVVVSLKNASWSFWIFHCHLWSLNYFLHYSSLKCASFVHVERYIFIFLISFYNNRTAKSSDWFVMCSTTEAINSVQVFFKSFQ